jgi:serine/threonine-protein kinase
MPRSLVSDLAGRVLAGRYVLQQAVGTGASGRVYVAQDTRLQRRVAVKVLHAALADDSAFLRRFRAEAQVAASLHHPHIVTVHDWGEDDVPFMVQELLEGGSLRSMLDEGVRMSVPQAARVARDVASALEYAHARGILHRDIKPANLLFDEHGIVRVADFGLARALAEASWTEPQGAVFGTARYASPEQAMGVELDARSDLYSLALVTVEAVTGRIPFHADTTIGMLTARTQRPLIAPDELGPLAPVVERAGRIEPASRYPDAATMRAALSDVAESLPPPAPLRLAGMRDQADPNPTQARTRTQPVARLFDQDAVEIVKEPPAGAAGRTGRRLVPFVVAAVLVVTVALASVALARVGTTPVEVPGLVGRTLDDARALGADADLDVQVVDRRNAPDPAGTVVDQEPDAGAFTRGGEVRVVVSAGPAAVGVPEVVGARFPDAKATLEAAGFRVERRDEFDPQAPVGQVVGSEPAPGERIAPESLVTLVVSKGHAPVPVPRVEGMTFAEAQRALSDAGLRATRVDEFHDTVDRGHVIRTAPDAGVDAPFDSEVQVFVSLGPDLVEVPRVVGLRFSDASQRLEDAGLESDVEGTIRPNRLVLAQSPEPGTRVRRGSAVDLLLDD